MRSPFDTLCRSLAAAWPVDRFRDVTTLVGVSGGADSVALVRALCHLMPASAAGRLVVAHFNHALRGEASDGDEDFVRQLAAGLDIQCAVGRSPAPAAPETVSEDHLRTERYRFFDATAHRLGARYVALAHTADDNIETVLHNLFRGTGPTGLVGMPKFRPLGAEAVVARPLLGVRRQVLRDALAAVDQAWRTDASNGDPRWNRNWLRRELLPQLRQRYGDADRAILRCIDLQSELVDGARAEAEQFAHRHIRVLDSSRLEIGPPAGAAAKSVAAAGGTAIVLALAATWDRLAWPRGEMSQRHWRRLLHMIQRGQPKWANLPGNLRASVRPHDTVVVERLGGD